MFITVYYLIKYDEIVVHTYSVFIEELNIISRITTHIDESDYSKCKLKLFLFETEDNVKKSEITDSFVDKYILNLINVYLN